MKSTPVALEVVYVAGSAQQAHLLADALEREGIAAFVHNEALEIGMGGLPPGFDTAPRVVVEQAQAARAREIALEFEAKLRKSREDASGGRAWHQFSIRALLFLTACVAVYFGVRQAAGGNTEAATVAVYIFVAAALFWAMGRKILRARA
jgi:hypothetical protein